jgi:hypothetical protein
MFAKKSISKSCQDLRSSYRPNSESQKTKNTNLQKSQIGKQPGSEIELSSRFGNQKKENKIKTIFIAISIVISARPRCVDSDFSFLFQNISPRISTIIAV